jgi:hypothetical protein
MGRYLGVVGVNGGCRDRANLWREAHRPDRGRSGLAPTGPVRSVDPVPTSLSVVAYPNARGRRARTGVSRFGVSRDWQAKPPLRVRRLPQNTYP